MLYEHSSLSPMAFREEWPRFWSLTGQQPPRRAEVPRADHHLRDDHGRLSGAEEAAVALRCDWRSPPAEEQELQAAGGPEAHEPGQCEVLWQVWHLLPAVSPLTIIILHCRSSRNIRSCWRERRCRTRWRSSSVCWTSWSRCSFLQRALSWMSLETWRQTSRYLYNVC